VYRVAIAISNPLANKIHTDALILFLKTGGISTSFY